MQTVLLSARKLHLNTLTSLGYQLTEYSGVYRSQTPIFRNVLLLSLNELSNEPHNLWIKCFASRQTVKKQTLEKLSALGLVSIASELTWFITGLMEVWFGTARGEKRMSTLILHQVLTELGKQLGEFWLARLNSEYSVGSFNLKKGGVTCISSWADRLAGLTLPERLADFKPEELEDYLKQLKKQQH